MAYSDPKLPSESSMPEWMKTQVNKENTTFETPFVAQSPPAYEDSFFYIRYPNPATIFGAKQTEAPPQQEYSVRGGELKNGASFAVQRDSREWAKHTEPCREVIAGYPPVKTSAATSITSKPKSPGVDDGFRGEGAACGSSILKVAQKMITGQKVSQRGYTNAIVNASDSAAGGASGAADLQKDVDLGKYNLNSRRGSRSLPTSPTGSPTSRRKNRTGNRYFAGTYEVPPDIASSRSWIVAALLGQKRDTTYGSSATINEEDLEHRLAETSPVSLAASVDNLGPSPTLKETVNTQMTPKIPQDTSQPAKPQMFRAKPTELREINFWSPTSM